MSDFDMRKWGSLDRSKYRGEWLALHPETGEVLAHGKDLDETMDSAEKMIDETPIIDSVPEHDGRFPYRVTRRMSSA